MSHHAQQLGLSGLVLVVLATGALIGAARPGSRPLAVEPSPEAQAVSVQPLASISGGLPVEAPDAELLHHDEPGSGPVDFTGHRYPRGLTIDGGSKHRILLFSFDDGPARRTTPELLDVLDQLDVRAMFFVTTESFGPGNPWEREHREIVREIVDRGHILGNHTETHRQLPLLNSEEIAEELRHSERKIANAIGLRPRLIRPPGGALSRRVEALLAEHGYSSVLWSIYGGDLEVDDAQDVVRTFFRVLDRREEETGNRGGIVLLHDTQRHSVEAMPRLVDALRRRNCDLLERGEELYDIVDELGYFIEGEEPAVSIEERQVALRERTARDCSALAGR